MKRKSSEPQQQQRKAHHMSLKKPATSPRNAGGAAANNSGSSISLPCDTSRESEASAATPGQSKKRSSWRFPSFGDKKASSTAAIPENEEA